MGSERVADVFSIAAAIMASLGGAGALIILLSGWLGKVWATRILEREKAELSKAIEEKKAELARSIERDKAELAKFQEEHKSQLLELSGQRQDSLNRKREVYTQLATSMRILLRANIQPDKQKNGERTFLEAYDKAYLWASEAVITSVRDLIKTLELKAAADSRLKLTPPNAPGFDAARTEAQQLDVDAQRLYQACMLELRRDAGFSESAAEYRLVSFA